MAELIELIKNPPAGEEAFLLDLLTHRVPPGVDDAAKVKASFLAAVAHGDIQVGLISKAKATELLGTMVGGYNVHPLIELLDDAEVAQVAADAPEKDAVDVRLLQRRGRQSQGRQRQGQRSDAVLGRCRVVHQPPQSGRENHRHRVQGARRDQHRRPVARPGCLEPPRHSACTTWRC